MTRWFQLAVRWMLRRFLRRSSSGLAAALLLACSVRAPAPEWSLSASDAAQRAMQAQLEGEVRVAALEWRKARSETAKTGQPALMARLALMQCALQVASLDWDACMDYRAYAADAPATEQAYHRYLYGAVLDSDVAWLPVAHQQIGVTLARGQPVTAQQLGNITDARARLVAAAVALRIGAVDLSDAWPVVDAAASTQGWRRPLMAWMELERRRLEQAGANGQAKVLARRLAVLQHAP